MITGLEIYSLSKEKLEMYELTKNTIVLFSDSDLKYRFVKEFLKIRNDEIKSETKDIIYCTIEDNDKAKEQDHKAEIKELITYMPTSIYEVDNEQKFIFTVEAPFVLQCNNPYDLWFCETDKNSEIDLYTFTDFKGYQETWNKGIYEVYREFSCGRFGCYEGYGK